MPYMGTIMIISEDDLLLATGYDQRSRLAQCLRAQGIQFFTGKQGRIWTTKDALNTAMEINVAEQTVEIDFV